MAIKDYIRRLFISSGVAFFCVTQLAGVNMPMGNACNMNYQYVDTTVNELRLAYPDTGLPLSDSIIDNFTVYLPFYDIGIIKSNKTEDQCLYLGFLLGGSRTQFGYFVIVDSNPPQFLDKKLKSDASKFVTTHGAYLGMTVGDFKLKYPCAVEGDFSGDLFPAPPEERDAEVETPKYEKEPETEEERAFKEYVKLKESYRQFYQYDPERMIYNLFYFNDDKLVKIEIGYSY